MTSSEPKAALDCLATYRGSDPANCARNLARAYRLNFANPEVKPWFDGTYLVEFSIDLEACERTAAISELVDIAQTISQDWNVTLTHLGITFSTTELRVTRVEGLTLHLEYGRLSHTS